MSTQVKVEDLEVLKHFRIALLKFAQAADQSLANAESQIARTHSWLDNEQSRFWEIQIRKRTEAVTIAKNAVRQKKLYLDGAGRSRNATEEEKALARSVAQLEEAQARSAAVKRALPRLEKAADIYRGGVSRLSTDIAAEIPRALARLDRLAQSLEQYVSIEPPAPDPATGEAPATPSGMSRGPETGDPPSENADAGHADVAASPPPPSPQAQEGRHVDHGQ